MTENSDTHAGYQSFSIEWLSEAQKHRELRRLRTIAEIRASNVDKHVEDDELPVSLCNYLDVYKNDRITCELPFMRATATREEIDRFRLQQGDVLITKDSESWDDIGVPALVDDSVDDLICGYHLAMLRSREEILGSYLAWALRSNVAAYQFHIEARGVTRFGLSHNGIQSVRIPLPAHAEQAAIVRFLDHADEQIQRYITAKERLIALLEEQRQVLIHQAVTRGLAPNVQLKDSCVEWLGEVPEHWERRRLKTILDPIDHRSANGSETLLSLRRDYGVVVYDEHFVRPSQSRSHVGFKLVSTGQLVVNRLQANNGLVFNSNFDGLVSPDYSVFEGKFPIRMQFLSDLLRTSPYRAHFRQNATGLGTGTAGFLRLYDDKFLDTLVYLPPLSEQLAIVEHLDKSRSDIGAITARTRRQIALMNEYRTRLIADVVTGQLDVREAAKRLPDPGNDDPQPRHEAPTLVTS